MPLSPALLAAYASADYVVFGKPELALRVGEASAALDALLKAEGAATAAFITAANPRGRVRSEPENDAANAALLRSLEKAGFACRAGEGRSPDLSWREKSVLVLGISRAEAMAAGRAFAQNAIVFLERGRAPELVLLEG